MKWPVRYGSYCRWVIFTLMSVQPCLSQENSIRFYGNGFTAPDYDRIKIPITSNSSVNVANDFTIECWIKCSASSNNGKVTAQQNGSGWITGNIFIDRDSYGSSDSGGDYGFSIGAGTDLPPGHRVVAFGIERMGTGITLRGTTQVADNAWHHIAVTRSLIGELRLYIDGNLDASGIGPAGNIEYNTARATSYPSSDPFLVLGAEKHDAGEAYPAFNGQMDELRISDIIRYSSNFQPATSPFTADSNTAGLYHFNEGTGLITEDAAKNSGSHGLLYTGGSPGGPVWVSNSPFSGNRSIQWLGTNAIKDNQKIHITWTTNVVNGNIDFDVERSADGVRFNSIRRVQNRKDCKESCELTFTDTHPLNGKNYYRIRSTNPSGEISYSSIVNVLIAQNTTPFKISQNSSTLVVQNTGTIESLVIWNREGRRLIEKKNITDGTTFVPLQNSKGFVFVHITLSDGARFTKKLVVR